MGFIVIDLVGIPLESLQLIQTQVQEEMRERKLFTYAQNEKLKKKNDQLRAQKKSISEKLTQKEEEECRLTQAIEDLSVELPRYNIQLEAPLLQKVKVIMGRAKDLEETVERMDADYKAARIVELEA